MNLNDKIRITKLEKWREGESRITEYFTNLVDYNSDIVTIYMVENGEEIFFSDDSYNLEERKLLGLSTKIESVPQNIVVTNELEIIYKFQNHCSTTELKENLGYYLEFLKRTFNYNFVN